MVSLWPSLTMRVNSRLKKGLRKHRRRYGTTLTALPRRPTPRASLGDLPVEVFDEVIAILHDRGDKPSMTACSLVSKTWRAVVLPHLFSTTSVREEQHFDRFLAFLDDSPHVSNCIQSLTLDGSSPGEVESEGGARLDCAAFTTVFPKLTRLRQLFLEDLTLRVTPVEICEESEESAHSRHSSPSSWLEALEVADVRCEDLEGRPLPVIPALVDMMPVHSVNLLRLDGLEDIADDSMQDFDAGVPSRAITVRHLSAVAPNGAATAAYFACYAKLVRVGSLSCISTYCETWGDAEELAAFLDLQSCSIETIDLDVTRLMQYERRPRQSSPHFVLRESLINSCLPPSQTHSRRNYHRADGKASPNPSSRVLPYLLYACTCHGTDDTSAPSPTRAQPSSPASSPSLPLPPCASSKCGSSCPGTGPLPTPAQPATSCGICLPWTECCATATGFRTCSGSSSSYSRSRWCPLGASMLSRNVLRRGSGRGWTGVACYTSSGISRLQTIEVSTLCTLIVLL